MGRLYPSSSLVPTKTFDIPGHLHVGQKKIPTPLEQLILEKIGASFYLLSTTSNFIGQKNSQIISRRITKRSMESSVLHVVAYVRHRKVFASLHLELRKNGKPKLFLKVLPNHQPNLCNNFHQNF